MTNELYAEIDRLRKQVEKAREALKKSVGLIRQWHDLRAVSIKRSQSEIDEMWNIYCRNAPEMKPIIVVLKELEDN